jgi:osmotically-inducible protein OsmY
MGESRRVESDDHVPEVREPGGYRRSDADISQEISQELADDVGLDARDIGVEVKSGKVTLTGTVRHHSDAQRAEAHACAVPGVTLVRNELTPKDSPARDASRATGAAAKMGKPGYER